MRTGTYLKVATGLSAAGTAFAGYLSLTRMTSGVCAFNEPCPFFLGYPACYTGFALFAIAFLVSLAALLAKTESLWPMTMNSVVGAAGILFAGRMTVEELAAPSGYRLGLPTCAYGLVFFLALLVSSVVALVSHARHDRAPFGQRT
jgi:hypothetical protein